MTPPPTTILSYRLSDYIVYVAITALMLFALPNAYGGDMTPAMVSSDKTAGSSLLDGKKFVGELGPLGEEAMGDDVWVFEDGMFVSKNCEQCGFPRSVYQANSAGEGTRFVVNTQCPKTDAQIVWEGVVKDGRIEGTWTWTRERWYWTIEKEFWFRGRLVDQEEKNLQTAATSP